ncbi:MAG: NrdH-redoxin, partial [Candidatus Bathyarchaeia archaeon]
SRIILGLAVVGVGALGVKDFLTSFRGPSFTIPAFIKPRIYQGMRKLLNEGASIPLLVSGVASLAFMVNTVELLCTAGLPAAYTKVLSAQSLPSMIHHAYLGIYVIFYMLDELALLAVFAVTLKALRPSIRYGRLAKLAGGILMLALGSILLVKPEMLTFF